MINLNEMTVEQVHTMYAALKQRHLHALEELSMDSVNNESGSLDGVLAQKEASARKDIETVHKYFKIRSRQKLGWAINELCLRIGYNKYLQIFFMPGSEPHQLYGDYIGGVLVFTPEEMAQVLLDSKEKGNERIEGIVKFNADEDDSLSEDQKSAIRENGFHCRDIYSVQAFGL